MKHPLLSLSLAALVAPALLAETLTWTGGKNGGSWQIDMSTASWWSPEQAPTSEDDVIFPAGVINSRIKALGMTEDITFNSMTFYNQTNLTIQGAGFHTSTRSITTRNELENPSFIPTNAVLFIRLRDTGLTADVGTNTVLKLQNVNTSTDGLPTSFVKKGPGMLEVDVNGQNFGVTDTFRVDEGLFLSHSYSSQSMSVTNAIIGDGIHYAEYRIDRQTANNDANQGFAKWTDIVVNTNAVYSFNSFTNGYVRGFYLSFLTLNSGTLNLNGHTCHLSASTIDGVQVPIRWESRGGEIKNGTLGVPYTAGTTKTINNFAAERPLLITGNISSTANSEVFTERGTAPVDVDISGHFTHRGLFKTGPGIVRFSRLEGTTSFWAKNAVKVNEGTLLADSTEGFTFNTNGVQVAAGATLGGVGRAFIGSLAIHGYTTVMGAEGNPAVLAPGSIDMDTGAHVYGTLEFAGIEAFEETADADLSTMTLSGPVVIRTGIEGTGGKNDKLAVNGILDMSDATTTLDINYHPVRIPTGEFTLLEFSSMLGDISSVKVNGDETAAARVRLLYRNAAGDVVEASDSSLASTGGSISCFIPPTETLLIIH